jgi:carboxyl-terminal processing protease
MILDLRDNPGGALNEAVDITNLFVPKGRRVVSTKGKMTSTNREYMTAMEPVDTVMPLVVLVDGGSASSSEIVCGSLQDMDRAVVMGSRTYGKGFVQMIRDVPYRGDLKITTSRYYIPSGRCIQAYDYRHLNPDGSVGTVPDSLTNVFHTAGGREVRDGGGIKPDVEVKPDSLPTLIYDLVASEAFFDYATQYAASHSSIAAPGTFRLSDDEYAEFVAYIKDSGFTYNRRSDEVLKLLKDVARREGYMDEAKAEFDALEAKFSNDLSADLNRFRKEIEPYVCDEIVHRFYYQRGGAQQQLTNDPCMERALELLADPQAYNKILGR